MGRVDRRLIEGRKGGRLIRRKNRGFWEGRIHAIGFWDFCVVLNGHPKFMFPRMTRDEEHVPAELNGVHGPFIKLHVPQLATVFSRQYGLLLSTRSIPFQRRPVSSTLLARFGNQPSVAFLREQDADVPILSLQFEARPKIFRAGDIQFIRG